MNPILELVFYIALAGALIVVLTLVFAQFVIWIAVKIYKRIKRKKEVILNDRKR